MNENKPAFKETPASRLNWTDVDWAAHLGCPVNMVAQYRAIVNDNFVACIRREALTNKYKVCLERRHDTPSGMRRTIPVFSSARGFRSPELCRKYAQLRVIPSLELNTYWAMILGIPQRALQMINVR